MGSFWGCWSRGSAKVRVVEAGEELSSRGNVEVVDVLGPGLRGSTGVAHCPKGV